MNDSLFERRFSFDAWTLSVAAVLAAALIVRLWALGSVPGAVHPDELAGVVGVLDEVQHRAPVRPFFDFRIFYLPLYGISEFVSTLFFGFTPAGLRAPAMLYGCATVATTIGLVLRLTRDRWVALVSGAAMAIVPWDVTVSRVAWEPAAQLPFLLGGLWALRAGLEDDRARLVWAGFALLAVDAYSYRAAFPDALVLGAATVATTASSWRRSRSIAAGILVAAVILLPLALSTLHDPSFFWRDRRIATFATGVNPQTLATFARNYAAHFSYGPLFVYGDRNPNHGPAFGVLYAWMLPAMLAGWVALWRRSTALGALALVWLLAYPLGGALTNDGVPHFLRTLIGAPLACMLSAAGLITAARFVCARFKEYGRAVALAAFAGIALVQFTAFCRVYFVDYLPVSAVAYQSEDAPLFALVRSLAGAASRACFASINQMNSKTLFGFYLRDTKLTLYEGVPAPCYAPRTILVTSEPDALPGMHLAGTAQNYVGRVVYYVFVKTR